MKNNFKEQLKVNIKDDRFFHYKKFVIQQQEQFEIYINYLNRYINSLRSEGVASNSLRIRARIKAAESALKNDDRKALDDVFGIEIICESDNEINTVRELIEKYVYILKQKIHDKENGYKAIHCSFYLNDKIIEMLTRDSANKEARKLFPIIEVQYKTEDVFQKANFGSASHEKYKKIDINLIKKLYENNQLKLGINLPFIWVSDPNHNTMRKLSTDEVIEAMYPSLKLKEKERI